MTQSPAATPAEVLAFWFAPGNEKLWFERSERFDQAVRLHLLPAYERAGEGLLADWQASAEGSLALVLLLDQVPRNLFRGTRRAFATDAMARAAARRALRLGHDLGRTRLERLFLYLPFEHSEDLAEQYLSEALIAAIGEAELTRYATRHREIIERFGRFPHRNAALERETTAEELAFLAEPLSSF